MTFKIVQFGLWVKFLNVIILTLVFFSKTVKNIFDSVFKSFLVHTFKMFSMLFFKSGFVARVDGRLDGKKWGDGEWWSQVVRSIPLAHALTVL